MFFVYAIDTYLHSFKAVLLTGLNSQLMQSSACSIIVPWGEEVNAHHLLDELNLKYGVYKESQYQTWNTQHRWCQLACQI